MVVLRSRIYAIPLLLLAGLLLDGCTASTTRVSSATLLKSADPAAAGLIAYLQSQHVPVITINPGETRILPTAACRDALIRFMELSQLRLDTCAANIANINATRDANGNSNPYRRRFVDLTSSGTPEIQIDQSPFRALYAPGHPDADDAGIVKYPNIDLSVEFVTAQTARQDYELAQTILQRIDPSIVIAATSPTPSSHSQIPESPPPPILGHTRSP